MFHQGLWWEWFYHFSRVKVIIKVFEVILLRRLENFAKEKGYFPTFSLAFLPFLAVQRLPSLLWRPLTILRKGRSKFLPVSWMYAEHSRDDYGKVQFSEWAPVTNGHVQRKRYQNTVRVKWNLGRRWQLVICGDKFMNFYHFLKDGGKCRFLPKIYDCILPGQDDILTE